MNYNWIFEKGDYLTMTVEMISNDVVPKLKKKKNQKGKTQVGQIHYSFLNHRMAFEELEHNTPLEDSEETRVKSCYNLTDSFKGFNLKTYYI